MLQGIPDRTLGWGVLEWGSTYLAQPDGENKGDTWVYLDEQARFLLWFYAVDERGKFVYRRGIIMRVKGFGKSPLLAAICCTELLGPVTYAGDDANGNPVGKPHPSPRVQLAGVSQDQADNTMSLVVEMLGNGEAVNEYALDIAISRVYVPGGKLEPVTASVKSREGQRPTFASLDETGLWTPQNKGPQLAATIRRNLGKVGGRSVEASNAFVPGEDSVAESTWDYYEAIQAGKAVDPGLLMDYRAAPADTDLADKQSLMDGLRHAYGDSADVNGGHVDLERVYQEIQDPATLIADSRRFYLNQIVKGSDQWIDRAKWEACALDDFTIEPGTRIALGFDGGIRDDSTALVGCVLETGAVFPVKIWEKPDLTPEWEVDAVDVDATVRWAFDHFDVVRMNADPAHWQDVLGRWALDFEGLVWEWWTNRPLAMARAIERFETAVLTNTLRHANDPVLTRHVLNARCDETPYGRRIRKDARGGQRKIDAAVAACLAYEARAEAIAEGALSEGPTSFVFGF